ncbi:Zinc finger NHR GATA-type protein [Rutstroemia sp. NJR-2017a BBW]|nr:Zinc finger NHR GATA-type protein [Rutstroemia sp. NJR-2017a BBW]
MNREHIERINTDTRYIQTNQMAASPASLYSSGPQPPYSAGWSASSHPSSGLISPPESRRTSGDKNPLPQTNSSHRQSLPSIHEALSSDPTRPGSYAPPDSASLPPSHQIPYTQSQVLPPPRAYPSTEQPSYQAPLAPPPPRQPSPPAPVQPSPFSRPESNTASFSESRRPSILHTPALQPPPPPANPYASRYDGPRSEAESRPTNAYPQPPPPLHTQHSYPPTQPTQPAPPSQIYAQPRYPPRDDRDSNAGWKDQKSPTQQHPHYQGVKRHLDVWEFENNLACVGYLKVDNWALLINMAIKVNVSSSSLQEWSRHFNTIAQEQQRSHSAIPARMPDIRSVDDMLAHNGKIQASLLRMRDSLIQQQHAAADEQSRIFGGHNAPMPAEYDEESVYGDERHIQGYNGADGKKRRGRAAPPGRCHSCNRAETPEWRRGPDGARTLCNACGLHYAKLTRKNTIKQSQGSTGSSLRPKSAEDHSPRS